MSTNPTPATGWSRRATLRTAVLFSAASLTACAGGNQSNGKGSGNQGTSPTSTSKGATAATGPSVTPANLTAFAAPLNAAADTFAGAAAITGATSAFTAWASGARDLCAVQAAVVNQPDALSGTHVTVTKPSATHFSGVSAAQTAISSQQKELVKSLSEAMSQAGNDDRALMLASLLTTATALSTAGPTPIPATKLPSHTAVGSRTDSQQVLLSRIDLAIEAIQRGLGKLSSSNPLSTSGYSRLNDLLLLRDQTAADIAAGKQVPSPGPVVYTLPGPITSADQITSVWGQVEAGIAGAWVLVAASSSGKDRATALAQASAQVARAAARGIGVNYWPGWA